MAQKSNSISELLTLSELITASVLTSTPVVDPLATTSVASVITEVDLSGDTGLRIGTNDGAVSPTLYTTVTDYFLSVYTPEVGDYVILLPEAEVRVLNATDAALSYTFA